MDVSTQGDTLSGRFHGQWAFLANAPPALNHGQTRSLPPSSSYLRSDKSNVSRRPAALPFHHLNTSRSSLARNQNTASVGGHSYNSLTNPPQPVLLPIHHSDVTSSHLRPSPRAPRRTGITMNKEGELPPLSAYSFEGILGSIREVIEEDLNGIAEILGQSRLVLADQHDSHLPPTGEIRAGHLPALAEASSSNERLAADDVLILNENSSLVEGSHAGSAAYGLLERLQAVPRTRRTHSDVVAGTSRTRPQIAAIADSRNSSPAILKDTPKPAPPSSRQSSSLTPTPSLLLLLRLTSTSTSTSTSTIHTGLPPTAPVVSSEIYLSAGADGRVVSDPPIVSEAGRNYPLYSYDESQLFESIGAAAAGDGSARGEGGLAMLKARVQRLLLLGDLGWRGKGVRRGREGVGNGEGVISSAERELRDILGRQPATAGGAGGGGGAL